jgi:hypothetical protein
MLLGMSRAHFDTEQRRCGAGEPVAGGQGVTGTCDMRLQSMKAAVRWLVILWVRLQVGGGLLGGGGALAGA